MGIPTNLSELLERIARETARMSYPGSMSRGTKPVVRKETKRTLEKYFAHQFPFRHVWLSAASLTCTYDAWHRARTAEIVDAVGDKIVAGDARMAVAAKFLNTFMHQLMKYEPCRPLFNVLHLPLDSRVFAALKKHRSPSLSSMQPFFRRSAYSLSYDEYIAVQGALWELVRELNTGSRGEFKLHSRIELNWLWL
jgi:hypothetical protein